MSVAVYVAGSSGEIMRVEETLAALRDAGMRITLDWTVAVRAARARGMLDCDLSDDEARRHARDDMRAVRRADVLLFLAPETATRGAWVELGAALALRDAGSPLRIVVSGSEAQASIFTRLADAIYATDDEAVAALRAWAAEQARVGF